MNFELSREQVLTLLQSMHLAAHLSPDYDVFELEGQILKIAHEFGMTDVVGCKNDQYLLNNLLSLEVHEEIDEIEDEIFWTQLSHEMAARDLGFIKSEEEITSMSEEEYGSAIQGQADRYDAEFADHGVDHLTLAHPLPLA